VAEHEDLQLLRAVVATDHDDQLEQAADSEVEGGHKQKANSSRRDADATAAPTAVARHPIEYLHPTR
jgi:hypothetical protein